MLGWSAAAPDPAELGSRIRMPEGFSISLYATDLPQVRFLRFTEAGDLLASQSRQGRIVLLERDADRDGLPDGRRILLEGLDRPHGMDFHEGWLYVAEIDAVGRVRFDTESGRVVGEPERVVTGIPGTGGHWTRSLRFGPDGWMYVTVGSSCNVCEERNPRRAAMLRYRPDGSGEEIYATGLRNTVGFDWRPGTEELYGTDNGRDLLGDDFPPCELNRIERGRFYGWPYANGARVPDPDYGEGREARIAESAIPVHAFGPHTAPLGITFVRHNRVPPDYRGGAFVALHGSWNRTEKVGYQVVSLHWNERGQIDERPFVWGFELDEDVIGRPVDVAEGPDGAFYISDDYAGSIYRVAWDEPGAASALGGVRRGAGAARRDPLADLPESERAERAKRGGALWEKYGCAQCHEGERAAEGVIVVELRELGARHDIDALAAFLAAPTPPMPAVDLTDAQRRDLAVYLLQKHR